jgi:ABC-type antimicrobial peptide transport system permease subunit
LAVLLAAAGLYSVVSYGVATRTNEFGIRVALGAGRGDVVRLVVSATSASVGAGLAAGVTLSQIFGKLAEKWVAESPSDPWILAAVTALLIAVAGIASLEPARRAAAVDPVEALRYQ